MIPSRTSGKYRLNSERAGALPAEKVWSRRFILLSLTFAIALLLDSEIHAQEQKRPVETKVREILVPFEDLNVLLEGQQQRVLLTRKEYDELLEKAKVAPADEKSPRSRVLLSADYDAVIQDGRVTIQATIKLDVLADELLAVPLAISGVTLRSATLDDRPAPLGRSAQGVPTLFVQGKGNHQLKLELIAPLTTSAAQQSLQFQLPRPAATKWRLTVPGNIEIKSGASVIQREVDSANNVTRFELLPERDQTTLVMSLNNRILMQQRVVLARSVLISELTSAYDKLHATISLAIPHGAADRFRFELPAGFEVTDVTTPLLARWAVEKGEDDARILDILLREAARDTVVIQIVAVNNSPHLQDWASPHLRPLDVASHVSVIGVLAEERLAPTTVTPDRLIPIDSAVLNSALPESVLKPEPGAPRLRPLLAFFAPQTDFGLKASFHRTDAKVEVTSNLLFTFNDRQLQLRGGFALFPLAEPLFIAEIVAPANWQITDVTTTDGTKIPFEIFPDANDTQRVQIRLAQAAPPGRFFNLFVHATSTPAGWLNEWSETAIALPVFSVQGASRDIGAVAVQTFDDLIARPDQLNGLTPLDEKEKAEFGLAGTPTSLAYRYDAQPYSAALIIERPQPRLTARTFSFLRIEPEGLLAHYELIYEIDHARARRLMLRLPADTPEALNIRGMDVAVKEFRAETVDGNRRWIVELAEPRSGSIRLAVDFQQSLPESMAPANSTEAANATSQLPLPLVRAEGVVYQSGTIAVEGNVEFDVQLKSNARKVDVGELVDAEYQVGKRLLGAFGFVGEPPSVLADVTRRPEFGLPSAIVQRAELVTAVSPQGISQTAARFELRTKAPFLEVMLPVDSTLWSATVGGQPAAPQRDGDRLLISFPSTGVNDLRDLHLVYETPIAGWSRWGQVETEAPKLLLRDEAGTQRVEVPLADLHWHLLLPDGQQIVRTGGSVFLERRLTPRSPAAVAAQAGLSLLTLPAVQTARVASSNRRWRDAEGRVSSMATDEAVPFASPPPAAEPMAAPQSGEEFDRRARRPMAVKEDAIKEKAEPPQAQQPEAPKSPPMPVPARDGAEVFRDQQKTAEDLVVQAATAAASKPAKVHFWALQGVRSLPVELARAGEQVTFLSLGVQPRLRVTLVNSPSLNFLAAALAMVVGLAGLVKTTRTVGHKARFVLVTGSLLLAAPLVIGLLFDVELTQLFAPAFYVTCVLILWYLVAGFVRWLFPLGDRWRHPRRVAAITASVFFLMLLASDVQAQQPASIEDLRHLLTPPQPVNVPADAVVIPYDAGDPLGPQQATKVFVPYTEYVKLWNRANPDKPLNAKAPVTAYAVGGATYLATLEQTDSLIVKGSMDIEVFAEGSHQIPLPISDAVFTSITIDGQPARLQVIHPAAPPAAIPAEQQQQAANPAAAPQPIAEAIPAILITGTGRKRLEFELRFKVNQSGGWRMVSARVPVWSATALDLTVPQAKTEVRLRGAGDATAASEFETQKDQETIRAAVPGDGRLQFQWRPKIAQREVDQSLTARSTAVIDIQEDAIRLIWSTELAFRQGLRDTFTFVIPSDFLLEKVLGANVRGWKSTRDGEVTKVEVTLLKSAANNEKLAFVLSKRGAIGDGAMAAFDAPWLGVADAALHQGTLLVRRSPLLEIRIDETTGLNRADANEQEVAAVLANVTEDNPLGIRLFQTYRFAATPFRLRMGVTHQVQKAAVEVQALLKISDRDTRYESRLNFNVENRPRYRVQCRLPAGLQLDDVAGPTRMEWTTKDDLLNIFLPDGQQQFSIVLRGRLEREGAENLPLPRLEVLDVERQTGQIVIQSDPGLAVRAEDLRNCESVLLERVFSWLNEDQRRLARLAISYQSSDFAGTLHVTPRQARVRAFTITNSRITPYAVEDTVYLQFAIADAGIRSVRFQLPADMRDARFMVPLLRQKTIESIADRPGRIRITLDLQDEVTDQLIVLVEHDRALTSNTYDAPIPVVETGITEQRFVVLESAGRDEVIVTATDQLTELSRQQSQWHKLAETLGDRITRAFLIREGEAVPRLTVQTRQRATVETAGARIGLAKTLLIVDGSGAYRGIQEYHVDNKTEQYLEVELPEGAALWTARVANEPVKPVASSTASGSNRLRVPLIKTAAGDLDYVVELKYGGRMALPPGFGQVAFPLMHTTNIHVESSQVRLRLPETQKWFDFSGTMRRVHDRQELLAGYLSYESKQLQQLLGVARGEGDMFSKLRASNNLKQLGLALHNYQNTYRSDFSNDALQREIVSNSSLLQQADQVLQEQAQAAPQQETTDNRALLILKCAEQPLSRSKNVVNQLNANFDSTVNGTVPGQAPAAEQKFNLRWLEENKLQALEDLSSEKKEQLQKRLDFGGIQDAEQKAISGKDSSSWAVNELGKKVAESANAGAPATPEGKPGEFRDGTVRSRSGQKGSEIQGQLEKYQQRLEQQQQLGVPFNAPMGNEADRDALERATRRFALGSLETKSQQVDRMDPGGVGMPGVAGTGSGSGMGMGGGGMAGGFVGGQAANLAGLPIQSPVPGLKSLEVQFPERGVEYLFVTPRGEIAIEARAIDASRWQRVIPLTALIAALAILGLLVRFVRRVREPAVVSAAG